jgi:hypothetical protein
MILIVRRFNQTIMNLDKGKKLVVGIVLGCVILAGVIFFAMRWSEPQIQTNSSPNQLPTGLTHVSFSRTTYEAALTRAKSWKPDASLVKMTLAPTSTLTASVATPTLAPTPTATTTSAPAPTASPTASPSVVAGGGAGQNWNFTFVSREAKGKGFVVDMSGQDVVAATEIPLSGCGATLSEDITTPDEAIAAVRTVSGYATSTIESVELIHEAVSGQWYWGVMTDNGVTVSVKAGFAAPCD